MVLSTCGKLTRPRQSSSFSSSCSRMLHAGGRTAFRPAAGSRRSARRRPSRERCGNRRLSRRRVRFRTLMPIPWPDLGTCRPDRSAISVIAFSALTKRRHQGLQQSVRDMVAFWIVSTVFFSPVRCFTRPFACQRLVEDLTCAAAQSSTARRDPRRRGRRGGPSW